MMATAQRMTASTITIATDNGFEDNDGDDATGNDNDDDGDGATGDSIDDNCNSATNVNNDGDGATDDDINDNDCDGQRLRGQRWR